ncbi:MAG: hypothetical protein CME63_01675 [Halobacteriovoraceae bacterium]|nr:hypothetical protein [Halobacteriovoraceae bacterium]|tara:strand:+ start:2083 stop:2445 length:363 start_codon:yes stop_codon:yes gene_type:complete
MSHLEIVKEVLHEKFKGKSVNPDNNGCLYRNENGKRCVVGCFIPDDSPIFDNHNQDEAIVIEDWGLANRMPLTMKGLQKWQEIHDTLDQSKSVNEQRDILINAYTELEERYLNKSFNGKL